MLIRFAGIVDPRRVLIIEAAADTCMPQASRERLWQAMGGQDASPISMMIEWRFSR